MSLSNSTMVDGALQPVCSYSEREHEVFVVCSRQERALSFHDEEDGETEKAEACHDHRSLEKTLGQTV